MSVPKPRAGMAEGDGVKYPFVAGKVAAMDLNGCRNAPASAVAATYTPGQVVQVSWDLKIVHPSAPGVRIALGYPGEVEYQVLKSNVNVGTTKGTHSTTVTMPAKPCTNCVLHWLWESTVDGGYYIGCSDVSIRADAPAVAALVAAAPAYTPAVAATQPVMTPAMIPSAPVKCKRSASDY